MVSPSPHHKTNVKHCPAGAHPWSIPGQSLGNPWAIPGQSLGNPREIPGQFGKLTKGCNFPIEPLDLPRELIVSYNMDCGYLIWKIIAPVDSPVQPWMSAAFPTDPTFFGATWNRYLPGRLLPLRTPDSLPPSAFLRIRFPCSCGSCVGSRTPCTTHRAPNIPGHR